MEIVIIGLVGLFPLLGFLALDSGSPHFNSNAAGLVRGGAIGLGLIAWWCFAPAISAALRAWLI